MDLLQGLEIFEFYKVVLKILEFYCSELKKIIGPSVMTRISQKAIGKWAANLSTTSLLALGNPAYKIILMLTGLLTVKWRFKWSKVTSVVLKWS